ncbi:MAG: hypothetical protein LBT02_02495 [Rickettsiales bacterium]|jgi:hypothetical protein|nr:hypothetical protein [Rickettsiales bacterium]
MIKKIVFSFLFASNIFALEPLYVFKTWNVFSSIKDGKDVCYIMSLPVEKRGNYKQRGEPYLMVIKIRGQKLIEVVVSGGHLNNEKKAGDITILKRKFPLIAKKEKAFTVDRNDDEEIVRLLQNEYAKKIFIKNYFTNGFYAIDVYSTVGFNDAYQKLIEICVAE